MSQALRIAKQTLTLMGKPKKTVNGGARQFADSLQEIIAGQPRKAKKRFYKAYEILMNNTNNGNSRNAVREFVSNSKKVAKEAQRQTDIEISKSIEKTKEIIAQNRQEYIPSELDIKLEKICGASDSSILSQMDNAYDIEKMTRQVIGDSIFNMNRCQAITNAMGEIIETPVSRININNAVKNGIKNLEQELGTISIDASLSQQKINEIATNAQKAAYKEAFKSFGKVLAYPFTKTASFFIPSTSKQAICKAIDLSGFEFGQQYYLNLLDVKGIRGRAPKQIQVLKERAKMTFDSLFTDHNCQGGFNLFDNTISFTNEFRSLPKRIQASFVSHELNHFEQADQVIRTFGIDRYVQALKTYTFKTLKNSTEYKNISDVDLMRIIEDDWIKNGTVENIKKAFAKSTKAEKILLDSDLGQKSKVYLDAIENYTGLKSENSFFLEVSDAYRKNALEKEAYKTGGLNNLYTWILQSLQI